MSHEPKTTTDHAVIKDWAEKRGATPCASYLAQPHPLDDQMSVLEFVFPGNDSSELVPITWEQFFEQFDAQGLTMVYQEHRLSGERSNFCRIVRRQ